MVAILVRKFLYVIVLYCSGTKWSQYDLEQSKIHTSVVLVMPFTFSFSKDIGLLLVLVLVLVLAKMLIHYFLLIVLTSGLVFV